MPPIDTPPREELGSAIRALRLAQRLSLREVAERSGVARSAISAWETGGHASGGPALDAVLSVLCADPGLRSRLLAQLAPRYAQETLRSAPLGPPVHVGQLFRAMRRRRDLSQGEVARSLGVGQAHLARWETGDLQVPEERREELLAAFGATEIERESLRSVSWETPPTMPASLDERLGEFVRTPFALQPILLLGWEADLWRRASGDDAWRESLCQVVSLRANGSLVNGDLRMIDELAKRAIRLAESTGQWRVATHAFYADRWQRRAKHGWAEEARAMEEWASRLPDSRERAWTMSCQGQALAHLGQEEQAISMLERALDMGHRHGVNRDHSGPIDRGEMWLALGESERALDALGDSRFPQALYLRTKALLKLGEEVPSWLLETARFKLGSMAWLHRQKLTQIERMVARRASS